MDDLTPEDENIIKQYLSSSTFKERITGGGHWITMSKEQFLIYSKNQLDKGEITQERYDYLVDYVSKMKSKPKIIK